MFALVAPFIAGSEDQITDAARDEEYRSWAPSAYTRGRAHHSIAMCSIPLGLEDQARALAVFAAERLVERRPTAAILFSESEESSRELAEEMRTNFGALVGGRSSCIRSRAVRPPARRGIT